MSSHAVPWALSATGGSAQDEGRGTKGGERYAALLKGGVHTSAAAFFGNPQSKAITPQ